MVIMTSCPGHGLVSYTQSSQSTTTESLALPPKGLSSGRQRLMALFLCQGPRFVSPSNSFFMIMIIILAFYLLDQEWRTKVEANTVYPDQFGVAVAKYHLESMVRTSTSQLLEPNLTILWF